MHIIDLVVHRRSVPLSLPFTSANRGLIRDVTILFVELRLADGTSAWGEISTPTSSGETLEQILAALRGPLCAAVRGQNVLDPESLLDRVDLALPGSPGAKSAVDIAVHDAYARALSVPLHTLWGGVAKRLASDATVGSGTAQDMARRAVDLVRGGCTALKVKVGRSTENDVRCLIAIREAVGPAVRLRLDANQGWTPEEAVSAVHRLEDAGVAPELLEQPVAARDLAGLRFVRERVDTLIAADESVGTARDALEVIRQEAADVLTLKLQKNGGIRPVLRIVSLAEAAGMTCMISCMFESAIAVSAAAAVAAARRVVTYVDLDAPLWLAKSPVRGGVRCEGSTLWPSDRPGLGVSGLSPAPE